MLRAVAVLAVVAYHMGTPVTGGFLGVDFFVISGFVITGMVLGEWSETGKFSLKDFFVRRFMRLVPALGVLLIVVLVVSSLLIGPASFPEQAALTALFAVFWASNFQIGWSSPEYFGPDSESNLFLNLWSLSLEAQFYLLYGPLLALAFLVFKTGRRRWGLRPALLVAIGVASLSSFALSMFEPRMAENVEAVTIGFFSPLSRVWEFGAGALVFLLARGRPPGRTVANCASLLGLTMIALSFLLFDGSLDTPGPSTLVPVGGSALFLWAGDSRTGLLDSLSSNGLLERIGNWSYSIYLWHWPLLYLTFILDPERGLTVWFAGTLSIVLGAASHRWVEERFRVRSATNPQQKTAQMRGVMAVQVTAVAAALSLPMIGQSVDAILSAGNSSVMEGEIGNQAYFSLVDKSFPGCSGVLKQEFSPRIPGIQRCHQSSTETPVTHVLLGDSHAEHLFPGLAREMPEANWAYFVSGGMDPI